MRLSQKQKGVARGMAMAICTVVGVIFFAILFDPFKTALISETVERLTVLGLSLILPSGLLIFSIGRLAKFRFFSAEDIDGSGLSTGSNQAKLLQSLLQNTLEQLVIVLGIYTAWCLLMPAAWLSTAPLCSILFFIGRICFFKGYSKGAPARAFGFALTFYSSAMMFLVLIVYQLISLLN